MGINYGQWSNKSNYEPPGYKPLVVKVIVVGPFEEEEGGTGPATWLRWRVRIWTPQFI